MTRRLRSAGILIALLLAMPVAGGCAGFPTAREMEARVLRDTGEQVHIKTVHVHISGLP